MPQQKLEWKVVTISDTELEERLNSLTTENYEIFNVQYTGNDWTIIARTVLSESQGRRIGFGAPE